MPFKVGDIVVYPHHGTAKVVDRSPREVFGETKEYLELRIAYRDEFEVRGDLVLSVPVDKAEEIGLRSPIDQDEVEDVLAVLAERNVRLPSNWSRRFKNHVEKLKSGEIWEVAEVVRNMAVREHTKNLSAGEKNLYRRARQILISELAAVWKVEVEEATERVDKVLYANHGDPEADEAEAKAKADAKADAKAKKKAK